MPTTRRTPRNHSRHRAARLHRSVPASCLCIRRPSTASCAGNNRQYVRPTACSARCSAVDGHSPATPAEETATRRRLRRPQHRQWQRERRWGRYPLVRLDTASVASAQPHTQTHRRPATATATALNAANHTAARLGAATRARSRADGCGTDSSQRGHSSAASLRRQRLQCADGPTRHSAAAEAESGVSGPGGQGSAWQPQRR